jgi:hypothetical protein
VVREAIHTQTSELSNEQLGPQPDRVCGRNGYACQHPSASRETQKQQVKARRMLHFHRLQIGLQYHQLQSALPDTKKILTNDEGDFFKSIHDAVYFKCNGKRFYLKNGVH